MKTLSLSLLVLVLTCSASAQNSAELSDPTDVIVVQKSWRLDVRNSMLEADSYTANDPFRGNDERNQAVRDKKENARQNEIRIKQGEMPQPYVPRVNLPLDAPQGASATYIYSAKIKNIGTKTILALVWEYAFVETKTQKDVGNHRSTSKVNIRPGKSADLAKRSASPPEMVVHAEKSGKDSRDQLSERVIIQRIEYADGSVWQRPSN